MKFVTCPTREVFKGIDGVESILRNKYLRIDPLAQYDIRSDNKDSSNKSDHQAKHGTNSSQRAFPANLIDIIRAIREEAIPAPTALNERPPHQRVQVAFIQLKQRQQN